MATRIWQDVDSNWTNTANWSGATVPVAGDTVRILNGNKNITTNVDQSAVNITYLVVGPDFAGTIGTPTTPLKIGTATSILLNTPKCTSLNLWPSSCTTCIVSDTHENTYACNLIDGDFTTLIIDKAKSCILGAALNIANSGLLSIGYLNNMLTDSFVTIESGFTLGTSATIRQLGGSVVCRAAAHTIDIHAGNWRHEGDTNYNITTLTLRHPMANFLWNSLGGTLSQAYVYGGILDGSGNGSAKTLTNAEVWSGGTIDLKNNVNSITVSNPIVVRGTGVVKGDGIRTITLSGSY